MLCRGFVAHVSKLILSSPQKRFPFSSTFTPNPLPHSFDDNVDVGSAVYRHTLKFQRPRIIRWRKQLENTVSFIGAVTRELQVVDTKTRNFGVYTSLKFRTSHESSSRVLLMMWGGMAEFASKHLKPNDFIYVSGCLGSYTKDDGSGNLRWNYKITVKELNFVAQRTCNLGHEVLESTEGRAGIQDNENRLYLWQVFFANPREWWDYRKRKVNPKQPDFKHKDTGEALWLSQYDPRWVKRQLQLLDSKIAEGEFVGPRSRVTTWVYHE